MKEIRTVGVAVGDDVDGQEGRDERRDGKDHGRVDKFVPLGRVSFGKKVEGNGSERADEEAPEHGAVLTPRREEASAEENEQRQR